MKTVDNLTCLVKGHILCSLWNRQQECECDVISSRELTPNPWIPDTVSPHCGECKNVFKEGSMFLIGDQYENYTAVITYEEGEYIINGSAR